MKFTDLGLSDEVLRAVHEAGYEEPTPIQEKAIPVVMMGRDVLGCAQTGTGKTASFTLPMIDILAAGRAKARMPRSLILEPTRELAAQVAENFEIYGKYHKLSKALLIGGSSMEEQLKVLNRGVDVLIATPGRLLDVFDRGHLLMNDVKVLVIDEADRMLDMGFIPDVEKIVSLLSPMRTTLLFSATMPKEIRRLADKFLSNPKEISVSAPASTADTITQGLLKLKSAGRAPGAAQKVKRDALRKLIRAQDELTNALVFCNRKRDVDVVYRSLEKHGFSAARLHGDMVQSVRMDTLDKFKKNEVTILVCSDVAARGLDISTVSHVFNFDVPTHAEDYVHRIGRTGRAGRKGAAFTLMMPDEKKYLDSIEKLIGKPIPLMDGAEETPEKPAIEDKPEEKTEEKPKRTRGRKAKPKSDDEAPKQSKADDDAPKASEKKKDKPAPKKDSRSERKPAKKNTKNEDADDNAWGEHMPAFLKKEVVLGKG
ncbi:MAG: DEAD/DEAH box helicase [Rhodospirillales bacterium]|nr:DEAD/DEAH box helicase [Rhodospirillales bacterium]MBO6786577.1 DEAD/DEAH box helicase [Rhodospirillales bacterium]